MATHKEIYYFDASVAGPTDVPDDWNNDANAFNGSLLTYASNRDGGATSQLSGKGTTAPSSGRTVVSVRARSYTYGQLDSRIYDSGGTSLGYIFGLSGTGWDDWVTLTAPSGGWTWNEVQNLEAATAGTHSFGDRIYRWEIEVTTGATLNNFWGAETGGLEEALAFSGASATAGASRNGGYGYAMSGNDYIRFAPFESVSDAGNDYVFGFAVKGSAWNALGALAFPEESAGQSCAIYVNSSGNLEIRDANLSTIRTGSTTLSIDTWHFIEVYFQRSASGTIEVFVDGTSQGTDTGQDLLGGGTGIVNLRIDNVTGSSSFDDIYFLSGATSASDRLEGCEVKRYASNNATRTGDSSTISNGGGVFTDAQNVPFNSGTNILYSLGNNGIVWTDDVGGDTAGGPNGDGDISGHIAGAKFVFSAARTNGSTPANYGITYGTDNNLNALDNGATFTTTAANYFYVEDTSSIYSPDETEYLAHGGNHSSNGGRDVLVYEMLGQVLHIPTGTTDTVGSASGSSTVSGTSAAAKETTGSAAGDATVSGQGAWEVATEFKSAGEVHSDTFTVSTNTYVGDHTPDTGNGYTEFNATVNRPTIVATTDTIRWDDDHGFWTETNQKDVRVKGRILTFDTRYTGLVVRHTGGTTPATSSWISAEIRQATNFVYLRKYTNGSPSELAVQSLVMGQGWYEVEVVCEGTRYEIWVDGNLILSHNDSGDTTFIGNTKHGAYSLSGTLNEFDDLRIDAATGRARVNGVGAGVVETVGSTASTSTVNGVSEAVIETVGSSSGTSNVTGVGEWFHETSWGATETELIEFDDYVLDANSGWINDLNAVDGDSFTYAYSTVAGGLYRLEIRDSLAGLTKNALSPTNPAYWTARVAVAGVAGNAGIQVNALRMDNNASLSPSTSHTSSNLAPTNLTAWLYDGTEWEDIENNIKLLIDLFDFPTTLDEGRVYRIQFRAYTISTRCRAIVDGEAVHVFETTGSAAGTSTVTGEGSTAAGPTQGTAEGTSTVTGAAAWSHEVIGSASGSSTVAGEAEWVHESEGSSDGLATVSGLAEFSFESVADSSGVATINGTGRWAFESTGVADGLATVTGAVEWAHETVASSDGTSTSNGASAAIKETAGDGAGSAVVAGVGEFLFDTVGTSIAQATSSADSGAIWNVEFTSVGTSAVTGISPAIYEFEGFRFRNDDGSESSASWKASQDINIFENKLVTVRLRTIIAVQGNPDGAQVKLQYREVGGDPEDWRDV